MASKNEKDDRRNRIIYVDLLRIAATFGVILLHVTSSKWYGTPVASVNWQVMNIYDSLVRWTVPVFVMISGVFHLPPNEKAIIFKQEMRIIIRKIHKLLIVIIFWGSVYNIISGQNITQIPAIVIFGPAWYHLWFLYMLIGLYLLTPIFRCLIAGCKQEHIEYFLILFFIMGSCVPLINMILDYFPILKGRKIYLPASELSGYIGYYIAGYYFSCFKMKKKIKIMFYVFAIFSLLFTIFGTSLLSLYKKRPVEMLYGYLLPNTMFAAYGIFLFFQEKYEKSPFTEKTEDVISKLSKNTFGIFLLHALVIQVFGIIGIDALIMHPIISIPLISITVMIISLIGTLIINKLPVVNNYIV